MFDVLDMGASGLVAQRTRMDVIASNILHVNTTRNAQGQSVPYRRKLVTFAPVQPGESGKPGVKVDQIREDPGPFVKKFMGKDHPDADKDGNVLFPNVDLSIEYVNALEASRAYEANITMMETSKAMIAASLRLIA
jgi:flagellar basal-body rod protein FlgC